MHSFERTLGRSYRMVDPLPLTQRWRRYFRRFDFSKARHNTPYAPSGSFAFGFAFLIAISITAMQITS